VRERREFLDNNYEGEILRKETVRRQKVSTNLSL